jgi:hypothetical protein
VGVDPAPAKLPRPPRGSTPESFHRDYLPGLLQALLGTTVVPSPTPAIGIVVGESGYSVSLGPAGVVVAAEVAEETLLRVEMDESTWRSLVSDLLPRQLRRMERRWPEVHASLQRWVAALPSLDLTALARLPGQIELAYTDDAGDRLAARARIGNGNGPRARLAISEGDLDRLTTVQSPAALASSLHLAGDIDYALRLVALLAGGRPSRV